MELTIRLAGPNQQRHAMHCQSLTKQSTTIHNSNKNIEKTSSALKIHARFTVPIGQPDILDFHQNSPFEASMSSPRTEFWRTSFVVASFLFKLGARTSYVPYFICIYYVYMYRHRRRCRRRRRRRPASPRHAAADTMPDNAESRTNLRRPDA